MIAVDCEIDCSRLTPTARPHKFFGRIFEHSSRRSLTALFVAFGDNLHCPHALPLVVGLVYWFVVFIVRCSSTLLGVSSPGTAPCPHGTERRTRHGLEHIVPPAPTSLRACGRMPHAQRITHTHTYTSAAHTGPARTPPATIHHTCRIARHERNSQQPNTACRRPHGAHITCPAWLGLGHGGLFRVVERLWRARGAGKGC